MKSEEAKETKEQGGENAVQCRGWTAGTILLVLALAINCVITYPLSLMILIIKPERIDKVYGVDTEARRILGCMYLAIAIVSSLAMAVWIAKRNIHKTLVLAVPLFAVQIIYKVASAFAVGLQDKNPVIIANLGVVAFQLLTLAFNRDDVAQVFL